MLDKDLLDILACPDCTSAVAEPEGTLLCTGCGKRYPIQDGIPVMLVEEAEPPPPDWKPTAPK